MYCNVWRVERVPGIKRQSRLCYGMLRDTRPFVAYIRQASALRNIAVFWRDFELLGLQIVLTDVRKPLSSHTMCEFLLTAEIVGCALCVVGARRKKHV